MIATNSFYAFKDADKASENITHNTQGDTLTLQVMGDASSLILAVYGKVDFTSDEWVLLNGINMTTLDVSTTITSQGIYVIPVDGLGAIKCELSSIAGGKVSVFCRITKGA